LSPCDSSRMMTLNCTAEPHLPPSRKHQLVCSHIWVCAGGVGFSTVLNPVCSKRVVHFSLTAAPHRASTSSSNQNMVCVIVMCSHSMGTPSILRTTNLLTTILRTTNLWRRPFSEQPFSEGNHSKNDQSPKGTNAWKQCRGAALELKFL
jgi:hypothetical protein